VYTRETGKKTKYLATESTTGKTGVPTTDIGRTIICMAKAFTNGQMEGSTKENMKTTKSMGLEFTHIQTDALIRASGCSVSSTEKVSL